MIFLEITSGAQPELVKLRSGPQCAVRSGTFGAPNVVSTRKGGQPELASLDLLVSETGKKYSSFGDSPSSGKRTSCDSQNQAMQLNLLLGQCIYMLHTSTWSEVRHEELWHKNMRKKREVHPRAKHQGCQIRHSTIQLMDIISFQGHDMFDSFSCKTSPSNIPDQSRKAIRIAAKMPSPRFLCAAPILGTQYHLELTGCHRHAETKKHMDYHVSPFP